MRRRLGAVAGALVLCVSAPAAAHWLKPEELVRGLASDPNLQQTVGVVGVWRDPKLPRLLVITVRAGQWETVPVADRVRLAEEWWETWRHNVPTGIVAVLDAASQRSLVNFDAEGRARLVAALTAGTPASPR